MNWPRPGPSEIRRHDSSIARPRAGSAPEADTHRVLAVMRHGSHGIEITGFVGVVEGAVGFEDVVEGRLGAAYSGSSGSSTNSGMTRSVFF
jgi:hypothetical protein